VKQEINFSADIISVCCLLLWMLEAVVDAPLVTDLPRVTLSKSWKECWTESTTYLKFHYFRRSTFLYEYPKKPPTIIPSAR